VQEGPAAEHLELLVQVLWLLNHLAAGIAAQRALARRQEGLLGQPDAEPTPHSVLAAALAEPLAGVCDEPAGSLSVAVTEVFIKHYDQILEGQVTYGEGNEHEQEQEQEQEWRRQQAEQEQQMQAPSASPGMPAPQPLPHDMQTSPAAGMQRGSPQPHPGAAAAAPSPAPAGFAAHQAPAAEQRPSLHLLLEEEDAHAAIARALEQAADVNETNEQGFTVLMVASSLGLFDVVALLLQAGAYAHLTDTQGLNAVHIATVGREASPEAYEKVLGLLLERSQQLGLGLAEAPTRLGGDTPLHFMAQMAQEETFRPETDASIVRMLLAAGAAPTALNAEYKTAQQIARQNGALSLAEVLASGGRAPAQARQSPKPSPSMGPKSPVLRWGRVLLFNPCNQNTVPLRCSSEVSAGVASPVLTPAAQLL